jgi:putative membrane-bound dehydrogenase-like protein
MAIAIDDSARRSIWYRCNLAIWRFPVLIWIALFAAQACFADSKSAQEALKQMQVCDGFEVSLVASEPEIRQPLSVTFDERGRMWVIQYLQYPTPAGLKPVSVDNYLRTKYDKVPEPPPRGPKGADRITICDLSDDHRRAVKFKDFVNGLNLCSGLALGYGGAFVLQPPYLLFYPDKNRDDIPDADPEVLLTGFGMEDAHAVANSLTWGPDGWLYGAEGSTVTTRIRNIEFQQGIWRYHPITKEFELFAEGGGNTWGMDFDERGEVIAGTNFDEKMVHQVQGAYYVKNFGKHGALHNSFTYGYFNHVPYAGYRGKHISCGGISYHGGSFPPAFNGAYIHANVLDHAVYWSEMHPQGSSFTASFGGPLLKTEDELFRPVDCEPGPDGAVYISDWCDKRASHVDPLDTWDRSNGRIYRVQNHSVNIIEPKLARLRQANFDLRSLSSDELVDLLSEQNQWFSRKARVFLGERHDSSVVPRLRKQVFDRKNPKLALPSLWALYVSAGLDEKLAKELLSHPDENVRAWTVRLLADKNKVSAAIQERLVAIARSERSPIVRSQLACSAKRLPGKDALPILAALLKHDEDHDDQHIPLLIWWGFEDKALTSREQIIQLFSSPGFWQHSITRDVILERLARRYTDEGNEQGLETCAQLLQLAPDSTSAKNLLEGMDQALAGRRLDKAPASLAQWFAKTWPEHARDNDYVKFGLRLGNPSARQAALALLTETSVSESTRISLLEVLSQVQNPDDASLFLSFVDHSAEKVREAALAGLQRFPQPQVAERLLEKFPNQNKNIQQRELALLCSRPQWAQVVVAAVDAKRIDAKDVSLENLRQMAGLQNAELTQQIEKRWGRIQQNSAEEKKSSINRLRLVLYPSGVVGRDAKGNPAEGKKVFQTACGVCHKLFGEGNTIGPDLTSADRQNTDYMLAQIVDPSAYIRPEYLSFHAELKDDRVIDGLVVESSPSSVTLLDRNNERHVIPRAQLSELKESTVSLMPEGLLEGLTPDGVMDLFAYLRSDTKKPGGGSGK